MAVHRMRVRQYRAGGGSPPDAQMPDMLEFLIRTGTLAVLARRCTQATPRLRWMVQKNGTLCETLSMALIGLEQTHAYAKLAQFELEVSELHLRNVLWDGTRSAVLSQAPDAPIDDMIEAYHADAAADLHPARFISPHGLLHGLRDVVECMTTGIPLPGDSRPAAAAQLERAVRGVRLGAAELRRTGALEHAAAFAEALDVALAGFLEVSRERRTDEVLRCADMLLRAVRVLQVHAGSSSSSSSSMGVMTNSSGGVGGGAGEKGAPAEVGAAAAAAAAAADLAAAAINDLRVVCCGPALSYLVLSAGVTALWHLDGGRWYRISCRQFSHIALGTKRYIAAAKGVAAAEMRADSRPCIGIPDNLEMLLMWLEAAPGGAAAAASPVRRVAAAAAGGDAGSSNSSGGRGSACAGAATGSAPQAGAACRVGGLGAAAAVAGAGGGGAVILDTAGGNTEAAPPAAAGAAVPAAAAAAAAAVAAAAAAAAVVVSTCSRSAVGGTPFASSSCAAASGSQAGSSTSTSTSSTNDNQLPLPPLGPVPGRRLARELVLRVAGAALTSARAWLDQAAAVAASGAAAAVAASGAAAATASGAAVSATGGADAAAARAAAMSADAPNGEPVLRCGLPRRQALILALEALRQSQQLSLWARRRRGEAAAAAAAAAATGITCGGAAVPENPRVAAEELAHWRHVAAACGVLPDLVQRMPGAAAAAAAAGGGSGSGSGAAAGGPSTFTHTAHGAAAAQGVAAAGIAAAATATGDVQAPDERAEALRRLRVSDLLGIPGSGWHPGLPPALVVGPGDRIGPGHMGRPLQLPLPLPLRCALEGGMLPALEQLLRRVGEDVAGPHAALCFGAAYVHMQAWLGLALSGCSSRSSSSRAEEAATAAAGCAGDGGGVRDQGLREAAALVVTYGKLLRRAAAPLLAFADKCCGVGCAGAEVARSAAAAAAGGDFSLLVKQAQHLARDAALLLRSWVDCLLPQRGIGGGALSWQPQANGGVVPEREPHQQQQQQQQQQQPHHQQQQQQVAAAALAALAARQWYPTIASLARRCWFVSTSIFLDDTPLPLGDEELRAGVEGAAASVRVTRSMLGPVVVAAAREFRDAFAGSREFHLMYGPALERLLPPAQRVAAAERTAAKPLQSLKGSAASHQAATLAAAPPPSRCAASLVRHLQSCDVFASLHGQLSMADVGGRHTRVLATAQSLYAAPVTGRVVEGWWRRGGWEGGGWLALYQPADVVDVLGVYVAQATTTMACSDAPTLALVRLLPAAIQLHPRAAAVNIATTAAALAAAAAPLPPAGELHARGPLADGDADWHVSACWRPEWLRARADALEAMAATSGAAAKAEVGKQAQRPQQQQQPQQQPQPQQQQGRGRRRQGAPPSGQGAADADAPGVADQASGSGGGGGGGGAAAWSAAADAAAAAADRAERLQATLASLRQAADMVERLLQQLPPAGSLARVRLLMEADEDEEEWWRAERERLQEEEEEQARKRRRCGQPAGAGGDSSSSGSSSGSSSSGGGSVADAGVGAGAGVSAAVGSSTAAGVVGGGEGEAPAPLLGAVVWRRVCAAAQDATWALQQLEFTCGDGSSSSNSSSSSSSSWLKTCSYAGCVNLAGDSELGLRLRGCGGGCGAVLYCCRECQVADWKAGHKEACGGRAAAAAPPAAAAGRGAGGGGAAAGAGPGAGGAGPAAAGASTGTGTGTAAAAVATAGAGAGAGTAAAAARGK
ncbi:hypothetical protein HYH02_010052 [Chlamydomonas schloesseri]|uniref:MYND-type domain-containing protein n=1 Tax=Chlamydomonas schloesseri TaxID=2026947 RepID=A0A835W8A4_9CHLO|nr:hypothetical protein HYH02_010052 [Chlamydomonas schloesseri]|eukprot:KAG2441208.1 hypothetical protein HYH02_010052 [Chlamydomonas schloesseri]